MKLFLASYRFGAHAEEFVAMASGTTRVGVIANAADGWPSSARESAVTSEIRAFRELGFEARELDLRLFDGSAPHSDSALNSALDSVDIVWVRGGNTFVLMSQLKRCGAVAEITDRVREGALLYAGYSAGTCVAQRSLRGIEAADDPDDVRTTTGSAVPWEGLGLVDVAFVPHFRSILDEDGAGERMVARYERDETAYLTLTDEQVYLVDGDRRERI